MICYVMYAFYAMGRKAICYGPEGNMLWAGRQYVWTGRSWPGRAYMWLVYWGYLTKLSGLQLWFYVSGSQESVARQRRDRTVPRVGVL